MYVDANQNIRGEGATHISSDTFSFIVEIHTAKIQLRLYADKLLFLKIQKPARLFSDASRVIDHSCDVIANLMSTSTRWLGRRSQVDYAMPVDSRL